MFLGTLALTRLTVPCETHITGLTCGVIWNWGMWLPVQTVNGTNRQPLSHMAHYTHYQYHKYWWPCPTNTEPPDYTNRPWLMVPADEPMGKLTPPKEAWPPIFPWGVVLCAGHGAYWWNDPAEIFLDCRSTSLIINWVDNQSMYYGTVEELWIPHNVISTTCQNMAQLSVEIISQVMDLIVSPSTDEASPDATSIFPLFSLNSHFHPFKITCIFPMISSLGITWPCLVPWIPSAIFHC